MGTKGTVVVLSTAGEGSQKEVEILNLYKGGMAHPDVLGKSIAEFLVKREYRGVSDLGVKLVAHLAREWDDVRLSIPGERAGYHLFTVWVNEEGQGLMEIRQLYLNFNRTIVFSGHPQEWLNEVARTEAESEAATRAVAKEA